MPKSSLGAGQVSLPQQMEKAREIVAFAVFDQVGVPDAGDMLRAITAS